MRPSHFSIQAYKNRLSRTQESTFHFDTLHIPLLKLYYNKDILSISYKIKTRKSLQQISIKVMFYDFQNFFCNQYNFYIILYWE